MHQSFMLIEAHAVSSEKPKSRPRKGKKAIDDPLEALRPEFDALVARIRTPQAKQAGNFLFSATGLQLGAFAQARALADARRKRE
jgi:hypothetical protein